MMVEDSAHRDTPDRIESGPVVYVDRPRCSGCGLCVPVCPHEAIRLVEGVAQIDGGRCRGCEACLDACPEGAILAVEDGLAPPLQSSRALVSRQSTWLQEWAPRALPMLGAALVWVGRDIVPRVIGALLRPAEDRDSVGREAKAQGGGRHRHRGGR